MCPSLTHNPVEKEPIMHDYAKILDEYELKYKEVDYYYQVGDLNQIQGWILHLSSIWPQIPTLLSTILPTLLENDASFKVVQNMDKAIGLCNGNFGYHQCGKIFCIFPKDDLSGVTLAKELLTITKGFKGCAIPTDYHLGGIIYTRYGSFNPKFFLDTTGRLERYIYNSAGQLIRDEYNIPFEFPNGVDWPFGEISSPTEIVPITLFKNSYKVLHTLKMDAKGRVMKGLRFNRFWFQWVIVKEANHGVYADEHGRDICDRLQWQHYLLTNLEGKVPLPKAYDHFTNNGNSYLVMEYVKGKSLDAVIWNIYQSSVWFNLYLNQKSLLIDYLLQVVNTVEILHNQGYVHRDLNSVNFIIDKHKKLVAIDLELAYSMNENTPDPPYTLGTRGFMSPEQMDVKTPQTNQDIYSLGALMIKFFTNLNPIRFEDDLSILPQKIDFFIRDKEISNLIRTCLDNNPKSRPDLNVIKSKLKTFRKTLTTPQKLNLENPRPINKIVNSLINALTDSAMIKPERVWHSSAALQNEQLDNRQAGITYSMGFYSGISGIMYVLAMAKCEGYNVQVTKEAYSRSCRYLHDNFLNTLPEVVPGLYYGAAGVGLSLNKGIEAGLIDPEYRTDIIKCLQIPATGLNIAYGVAGQGLAVLGCLNSIKPEITQPILHHCVSLILQNQQKDGSWITAPSINNSKTYHMGFSLGVAGICFFLLKYYIRYNDENVRSAVLKALHWLKGKSSKYDNGLYWRNNNREKISTRWLHNGQAGVVLCFITAYQTLGDSQFKDIAEKALRIMPHYLVHHDFSLAYGVTGLAEIYLMAAQVFDNNEWQERADFILNTLIHASQGNNEHLCYWITQENKTPTADFMVGNCGILHFLLRYISPQKSFFF